MRQSWHVNGRERKGEIVQGRIMRYLGFSAKTAHLSHAFNPTEVRGNSPIRYMGFKPLKQIRDADRSFRTTSRSP